MALQYPQVVQSSHISLTQTLDEIFVEFQHTLSAEQFQRFTQEHQLEIVKPESVDDAVEPGKLGPIDGGWLRSQQGIEFGQFYPQVQADEYVRFASPVYHRADLLPDRSAITFSDRLLVRFWPQVSGSEIKKFLKKNHCADISPIKKLFPQNLHHIQIRDPDERHVLDVVQQFQQSPIVKRAGPDWIQLYPGADATPNDLADEQWHLPQIHAEQAWDISQGNPDVIIAMLDLGFDIRQVDLLNKFIDGCDATIGDDCGDELNFSSHGTTTSGVAAADTNNDEGIAGVAWNCRLMPIRISRDLSGGCTELKQESWIIRGLQVAREAGVRVVNMSFTWLAPEVELSDTIDDLYADNIVLVTSSGNSRSSWATPINALATHEAIIAVGATNRDDQRQTATDDEDWHSKYGPGLSVVAPGVAIWTTYNNHGGCGPSTDLYGPASGTSFSAPQVAGLAALLCSAYPGLGAHEIRNIIERTAEKVGGYTYTHNPEYPNGGWNEEMGYGRINLFHALDHADVYIKDNPAHDGSMYFEGNFYSESDIVVRAEDNDVFEYDGLTRGETNYVYVRVNNAGPATARNVQVSVRAVNYPGTEFMYPGDWQDIDEDTHLYVAPLHPDPVNLDAATAQIFKFSLTREQVGLLDGWTHPCLLAEVLCENDYSDVPVSCHSWEHNNLAQRNISFAPAIIGSPFIYPFISGHSKNLEPYMELMIDRRQLPHHIELLLDPWETTNYFPAVNLDQPHAEQGITFLDRTRLATTLCGCHGILTLEAGSSFQCDNHPHDNIRLQGAEFVEHNGKRLIAIRASEAVIGLKKQPGERRQMSLIFRVPDDTNPPENYRIDIRQRNMKQHVVGGVAIVAELTSSKKKPYKQY